MHNYNGLSNPEIKYEGVEPKLELRPRKKTLTRQYLTRAFKLFTIWAGAFCWTAVVLKVIDIFY